MHQVLIHKRTLAESTCETQLSDPLLRHVYKCPDNLTIYTHHNYDTVPVFEKSMTHLGIDYISKKVDTVDYKYNMKIEYLTDIILNDKCKTDYILVCDTNDVVFNQDPNKLIKQFEQFNCDMLFNSTDWEFPYTTCMHERYQIIVNKYRHTRFLNAGVWIAKTKNIKDILLRFNEFVPKDYSEQLSISEWKSFHLRGNKIQTRLPNFPYGSVDQDIFRYILTEFYPRMQVDQNNLITYR